MGHGGYPMSWTNLVEEISIVGNTVADLIDDIEDFDKPGLGSWDVEALARHTVRAVATLDRYLDAAPADEPPLHDAAAYLAGYLTTRDADPLGTDAAVAERGRTEAIGVNADGLGDHLRQLVMRVVGRLNDLEPDLAVPTPWGAMRLEDYCRTRLCELVIHGTDLASATGRAIEVPESALNGTLALLSETAVRRGSGIDLLRLLSGRTTDATVLPILR